MTAKQKSTLSETLTDSSEITTYRFYLDLVNKWMQSIPKDLSDDLERRGTLGSLTSSIHKAVTLKLKTHWQQKGEP